MLNPNLNGLCGDYLGYMQIYHTVPSTQPHTLM